MTGTWTGLISGCGAGKVPIRRGRHNTNAGDRCAAAGKGTGGDLKAVTVHPLTVFILILAGVPVTSGDGR
jgi:hypothetical protein